MMNGNSLSQGRHIVRFFLSTLIWSIMTTMWGVVWYTFYENNIIRPFGYKGNWLVIFVYGLVLLLFSSIYGAYRVGYYKRGDVIFLGMLATAFTNGITYLQTCLVARSLVNVMPFVVLTLLDFVVIWVWGSATNALFQKLYPPHNMLVIYGVSRTATSLIAKMTSRSEKYRICETISVDDGMEIILEKIENYNSIILCDIRSDCRNQILKHCYSKAKRVYLTPKISDSIIRGAEPIHLFDTPLLLCKSQGLTVEQKFFKRIFDIIISLIGIVLTSPVMLITAIAIKTYDRGPAIFKQERCTIDGNVFDIYKFRSMIVNAEENGKPQLATIGDSRITPIGEFIRKTRLDELPQLFNILKGDMSIVGPRPERQEYIDIFCEEMPEFRYRMKVKAGLTGYAQVVGKYNTVPYDKLKLDLYYIENYSLWMDIKLILMTIKVMFMKESTEGFQTDCNTDFVVVKHNKTNEVAKTK